MILDHPHILIAREIYNAPLLTFHTDHVDVINARLQLGKEQTSLIRFRMQGLSVLAKVVSTATD